MLKDKYFSVKIPAITLFIVFVFILFPGLPLIYDHWPRYIVLDPPVPEYVFVTSEHKTTYIPYSGNNAFDNDKSWIWRKEYDFLPIGNNLDTAESIIAYFDKWLNEQGWKRFEEQGFPCGGMIEAEFLNRGENLFAYLPKDTKNSYYAPAVCLAVWPYATADDAVGFNVLLFSETP
jgi:hypothetical protein